jgi:hypothetical protein
MKPRVRPQTVEFWKLPRRNESRQESLARGNESRLRTDDATASGEPGKDGQLVCGHKGCSERYDSLPNNGGMSEAEACCISMAAQLMAILMQQASAL